MSLTLAILISVGDALLQWFMLAECPSNASEALGDPKFAATLALTEKKPRESWLTHASPYFTHSFSFQSGTFTRVSKFPGVLSDNLFSPASNNNILPA